MIITKRRDMVTFWDFEVFEEMLSRRAKGDVQSVGNIYRKQCVLKVVIL